MTMTEILYEMNSIVDASSRKQYLDEHLADIIDELLALSDYDREVAIGKLLETFDRTRVKGTIKRIIEAALANKTKNDNKKKSGNFTGADTSNMMDKNGNIQYTTSNVIDILLLAYEIKMIMDTMTEQSFFMKMSWTSLSSEFRLPLMTNGNTHVYYPYDNVNRTFLKKVLNENIFRTEKNWTGLDDIVEAVAHHEKIDMYEEWMISLPPWDGIDRITNPETNWVVRYLKATPGAWSVAWARMLPLSQVWRCFKPGCRQRYYFALEGEQNIGKTSFCKALLPPNPYHKDDSYWYVSTSIPRQMDKDFLQIIAPGAVVEFPDLDMNRFNLNDWKRLITETHVTFRAPYGRLVDRHPKRSIYIVTTNEHRYLRDPTGETRAIPIKSLLKENEFIDHVAFRAEYPQILAQIKEQYYLKGIEPFLTKEEMELQQEQIIVRDAIHEWMEWEHVEELISMNPQYENEMTIKNIVDWLVKGNRATELSINQAIRNRYGQVLRKMGYEPKRKNVEGHTQVVYNK